MPIPDGNAWNKLTETSNILGKKVAKKAI